MGVEVGKGKGSGEDGGKGNAGKTKPDASSSDTGLPESPLRLPDAITDPRVAEKSVLLESLEFSAPIQ